MLTIFFRASILFVAAVAAMRMMGKRQIGQLQPYELVVVIMIAELAATPIGGAGTPILYGLAPMAALMVCHGLIAALSMKSKRFRGWISGQPTVLIRDGVICEKQMRRMSMTLTDLMEGLRTGGILDPSEVEAAILETGGHITVFPKAQFRPLSPQDMGKQVLREGIPLPLVLDGEVQQENLERGELSQAWLMAELRKAGAEDAQEVFFASLNTQGQLLVQHKGETQAHIHQALVPEKAVW